MVMHEEDSGLVQWGLRLLDGDPVSHSDYYGDRTQHDADIYNGQYLNGFYDMESSNVENDEIIAHTLQEELSQLAVTEAPESLHEEDHSETNLVQEWSSQPMGNYYSDHESGQEETDDRRPSSSCSSPGEISYDGEEYSYALELTDESILDGEVGKRLNQMIPIPHIPRINGDIPSTDEATSDHQRLLDRLQSYGLIELKVQGDGNCQRKIHSTSLPPLSLSAATKEIWCSRLKIRVAVLGGKELGKKNVISRKPHIVSVVPKKSDLIWLSIFFEHLTIFMKGFFRYWNPTIKKFLGELSQAESEKESKLKSILQRLIGCFCEHHNKWRHLVSATAELDVLISLAIASDYYEGPTCRPVILGSSSPNEVPCFTAKSLGHAVLRSDSLGRGTFVPNDISIGGSDQASFILLTGPNMGGKSTLLRQVCLAVILAQVGADVPAESFELSPVDRIFVRMGAKDHIMAGQSTFLTELSETASMLSSATQKSLVALDELGRGTSTSDGQAIAESVLEHLVHTVKCRGMFSTHYHRLAVDYQKDSKVSLCHMGCKIGKGIGGVEEVTFLYRIMPGACPKSHGVNVARLAGLPDSILKKAAAKSIEFEAKYGKHNKSTEDESAQNLDDEVSIFIQELMNVAATLSCDESSERINSSTLIQLHGRANMLLQKT